MNKSKPVIKLTMDGEFVKEYPSTLAATKDGYDQGRVARCCRIESGSHRGHKWRFKNDFDRDRKYTEDDLRAAFDAGRRHRGIDHVYKTYMSYKRNIKTK